jgi:hypothetical protein
MKTRLGKIAQLPKTIRDQLNQRLENGQQSPDLLRWLNGLPNTKKLLAKKFGNQPITKSNLSSWRHGGFQDWRADQAREARIQRISESGASLEQAETGDLFENFARIAVAELMADLDSLKKLRDEKRSQFLHNLVRDLARLQSSYNRSRWAELAWTKYNDNQPPAPPPSRNHATACSPTPVAPDGGQSRGGDPHDSQDKTPYDPFKLIYHTKCDCGEPCRKCHAPDSEYPLDEVLRDRQFYATHGARHPYDRHGNQKHLTNVDCDCFCDRCAEKAAHAAPALRAEPQPGRDALPRDPIIRHAESRDEAPATNSSPQPPTSPENPMSSVSSVQLADFSRRMALLNTASHRERALHQTRSSPT